MPLWDLQAAFSYPPSSRLSPQPAQTPALSIGAAASGPIARSPITGTDGGANQHSKGVGLRGILPYKIKHAEHVPVDMKIPTLEVVKNCSVEQAVGIEWRLRQDRQKQGKAPG